jgi:hypothetical protein
MRFQILPEKKHKKKKLNHAQCGSKGWAAAGSNLE